jgi:hypothetical protein
VLCSGIGLREQPEYGHLETERGQIEVSPRSPENHTVMYEAAGDKVKVTVDGVDGEGKPTHNEWTGMFDGKDYPLTGDPNADTRSYKKIDDRTTELTNKKAGKVVAMGKIVISADGKSRTVTVSGTDPMGKKMESTAMYDKQ